MTSDDITNTKVRMVPTYCITRNFRGTKLSQKLIPLSSRNFTVMDSDPIAIINHVNIVSQIKNFAGGDKSAKTVKILSRETF